MLIKLSKPFGNQRLVFHHQVVGLVFECRTKFFLVGYAKSSSNILRLLNFKKSNRREYSKVPQYEQE